MYDRISALASIGVWECDLATETLTWTDTVYDLFDIPRGSAIDRRTTLDLYEESSRIEMERLRTEAIRTGIGFTLDIRVRTRLGNDRWIRLTVEVEQEEGRSVRIFGTKQDISVEKAAQAKLQAIQTELIHVSRLSAMNTMASSLAHEVNQPLTAIVNYLSAARRMAAPQAATPDLSETIEAASQAALRAGDIIRRTREMTARGFTNKTELDLDYVVREAVALATAGRPDLAVSYDLAPHVRVNADRIQIQQVLVNLVRNACESAVDGPCAIKIVTSVNGPNLDICVADTGAGIAPEILPRIFDSYATNKPRGMGLGLSICRTIIEAHDGSIRAMNQPEGGAAICFTLPLSRPSVPASAACTG